MRALSLYQPWASLIALGLKKVETRSWGTAYRGDVAVHAAKRWTRAERAFAEALSEFSEFEALREADPGNVLGAVVCVARLAGCVRMTDGWIERQGVWEKMVGGFAPGRWGWILEDVRPLAAPVPMRGRQGLWTLSDDEVAGLEAAGGEPAAARQGRLFCG